MEETITKLRFEEVKAITTINLPDVGLRFNAQKVGPKTFRGLRETDYGEGFRMPTIPELVQLIYASLENQNYDTAKNVVETFRNHRIIGNTGILYVPKGMFVQDNPELKDGRISMNQKALEKRLGSHEERRVVFSDNESIRFAPYGFKRKSQTPSELSINTGIIALVGGEKNAEKLAKASEHYRTDLPYFQALKNIDSPVTRVIVLSPYCIFGYIVDKLNVNADGTESLSTRYSFGVQKTSINL